MWRAHVVLVEMAAFVLHAQGPYALLWLEETGVEFHARIHPQSRCIFQGVYYNCIHTRNQRGALKNRAFPARERQHNTKTLVIVVAKLSLLWDLRLCAPAIGGFAFLT